MMATRRALVKDRAQLVGAADTPIAAALPAVALTDGQPNLGGKKQAVEDGPQLGYEGARVQSMETAAAAVPALTTRSRLPS